MAGLFQKLEFEAFRKGITPRSKESRAWFMNKAKNLNVSRSKLMKEDPIELRSRPAVGKMYMYFYDPKHKETLPYYDRFPLIVMIGPAPKGFMGLNLHYLPLATRAKFLDALLDTINNERYDESTRFRLSYEMLKRASKLKAFRPCLKRYLSSHVRSRLAMVPAPEWEIATFLPTADFEKASSSQVYRDSRRKMRA
tara:strand:+ start:5039 stop:5626 length:588 start_codon:yes stop_codon:yes gene_type:complete